VGQSHGNYVDPGLGLQKSRLYSQQVGVSVWQQSYKSHMHTLIHSGQGRANYMALAALPYVYL